MYIGGQLLFIGWKMLLQSGNPGAAVCSNVYAPNKDDFKMIINHLLKSIKAQFSNV